MSTGTKIGLVALAAIVLWGIGWGVAMESPGIPGEEPKNSKGGTDTTSDTPQLPRNQLPVNTGPMNPGLPQINLSGI